ncbi:protein PLASTID MOVEMENT IMPAIRED 1-RELATED 1 [Nicotiana tomentosiformis]|uniref:protein PLASTID MOVEMENT IMPAIRED 1-RELATED 1 n=1 Tax=Nicotiana tomentosiformis TaxID=4098 RepID=UPI00051B238D|nr:protein PLASTID MOVEMENT IMPAIRED 1-RELATED 1 [Nicotiana tomentosiformis]XP_009619794.1 protein PLASTID MOVEMENT IMPAIRED 1-RELATED 1 [Nicotiana tomentosiformis]
MLSRMDSRKKIGEKTGNGKLLNDIEAISKALYLDKTQPRILMSTASSRSKSVGKARLPDPKSKSKDNNGRDLLDKDSNKKSIWSWKSLKSLTHVKNRRFNCGFSLQVHCIEGLPPFFYDLSLVVHWRRRDGELMTYPVMVCEGIAEFEEQLSYTCSIYGSRNGPHHSAKYEAKHCLLYAAVYGTPELDLGKHRVDLTRLLPLTLEELEDEKSSGKWTTSYRLSGKAKGATMNVSFGYHIVGNGNTSAMLPSNRDVRNLKQSSSSAAKLLAQSEQSDELSIIRRAGSLPPRSSTSQQYAEEVKDLHEVLPMRSSDLSKSVEVLYQKLKEEKLEVSDIDVSSNAVESLKPELSLLSEPGKGSVENECEFSVIEQGIELPLKELEQKEDDSVKTIDYPVLERHVPASTVKMPIEEEAQPELLDKGLDSANDLLPVNASNFETEELIMKELVSALYNVSDLANEGLDSQEHDNEVINHDSYLDAKANYREVRKGKSLSMDYVTESVASDFLDMLGIEHSPFGPSSESEPDSPRELLLRQFEKDTLASGCSLFNLDMGIEEFASDAPSGSQWTSISEEFGYSSAEPSYEEMPKIEIEAMSNKTRASTLEDLETEALMREWGLNEKSFQYSSPKSSSGFGSPIHMPPEDPYQLPPLGEGLGPLVQTENGGFLRSMNPAIFKNAKGGGNLIMQVSSPVVVPAEMGSGIIDILQHLASIGMEKLSMQASKLMPLEDITGKTMEQIAWGNAPSLEGPERQDLLHHEFEFGQNMASGRSKKGKSHGPMPSKLESSSTGTHMDAEYVSLEDLAPLAMDKIEALSIEGLRIQSGMSDEDAPSNISAQSISEFPAFEEQKINFGGAVGLEGAGGLQLLDIKDNGDEVDGLMGLSLTFDEWMRLDSGEIYDEDVISERTSKLLAAHHAISTDMFRGRSKGEKRRGKGKKCGLLGNNFTVALMVQLRDPLRNYEPVGTPMLALVQVERVFVPPKPKIYSTVSEVRNNNEDDDDDDEPPKKDPNVDIKEENITTEVEQIPQYKITEVHVAGLKTDQGKKKLWGSTTQEQSGSRWLLANGMGKKNKHPLMKSKAANKSSKAAASSATTTVKPGDTLWSISSRVHGTGAKWKEIAALNPHIRNPNVILPNETIRLK